MLRARLRAGRRPERARELLAADFSSAWSEEDASNRGGRSSVRPGDIPVTSLVSTGGLVGLDADVPIHTREFDVTTTIGTHPLAFETQSVAWQAGSQRGVTRIGRPLDSFHSRGFAASAFGVDRRIERRGYASSPVPEPSTSTSNTPPFPLGTGTGKDSGKDGTKEQAKGAGTDMTPSIISDATSDEDLKVDLHALDRAKAEIDRLHLERQIKQAVSTWNKAVSAFNYVISLGPWTVSLTKMSKDEWRTAIAYGYSHFKDEMKHYWAGTKLLWVEIKIATRLLFKTLRGQPLTRRERRQMTRTTADVFRLVPFAAFILIPFMEVFLPVAIKLFPGMLPTTFRDELKHEEELKKRLKAKLEVARFLQDTVKVMAKGLKQSRSGYTREKADKLYDFMKKVRSGDATVTNDDITRFSRLFGDEFTLDHISRGQLTNMCKFVGLSPYGTDSYLRRQLKDKLKELKADDKVIYKEGLSSLSLSELQSISRARGMRADTNDRELLERHINDWLELSLNAKLPPSLLVLSRAFTITTEGRREEELATQTVSGAGDVSWSDEATDELAAKERQAAAMKDIGETLATLPEEVVISVTEERALVSEDRAEQVQRKLEFLEQEEELIEEENLERAMEEEALLEEKAKKAEDAVALGGESGGQSGSEGITHAPSTTDDTSVVPKKDSSKPAKKPKSSFDTGIDSVSLDEVQSVVQGKRARRAAKLSRLLAALAGVSALGVERKELTTLVRKELDMYGVRLRQVQKQLTSLDGDAAVAAAVAAEGDLDKAAAIEAASRVAFESLDPIVQQENKESTDKLSSQLVLEEEEERLADASELIPDEQGEEKSVNDVPDDQVERLPDPFELISDEDEETEIEGSGDKGWFRANYDAQLCDRVNDRVNKMLANVKKDLDAADGKIGQKFKVLDADGDGKISPEELINVKEMLKDALDDEGEEDLRLILAELTVDDDGKIDVADLSKLVSDLVEKELKEGDAWYAEDDYSVEEDWNSEESESKDSVEETAKSTAAGVDPKP